MNELLDKINQMFDNSISTTTNEETSLQLKILKGNINILFKEYVSDTKEVEKIEEVVPVTTESSNMSNSKKILIVDDSSIIRNYLQKACSSTYDVVCATGGEEAISLIPNQKADLILLDLMMPGVDGFGVLEYLKSNNITTPVIIISGDTTKETIEKAFTYNVIDMIEKPFSEKVIIEKINRVLG